MAENLYLPIHGEPDFFIDLESQHANEIVQLAQKVEEALLEAPSMRFDHNAGDFPQAIEELRRLAANVRKKIKTQGFIEVDFKPTKNEVVVESLHDYAILLNFALHKAYEHMGFPLEKLNEKQIAWIDEKLNYFASHEGRHSFNLLCNPKVEKFYFGVRFVREIRDDDKIVIYTLAFFSKKGRFDSIEEYVLDLDMEDPSIGDKAILDELLKEE